MCGRFAITLPHDAMAQLFDALPANDLPEVPNYNVCPTDPIHVATAGRRLVSMRWGLIPSWYEAPNDGPLLINARAEGIEHKAAFRQAVRERRCLVPASGFYEWTKDTDGNRLPWYITRRDGAPMALAAIWQDWGREGERQPTVAIVTTAANAEILSLHNRMPVILEPVDWPLWLGEAGPGAARLLGGAPDGTLDYHRVDPAVNSNRARGPHLVEPLAA
ncbi:SOS response-associated peptidase [Roseitranquillus sediminis]|uniref:SOS response-associated peptidase n=1 Tax=Roseitranquillus sediminis TaxID=2809051 RepID=UPI001D0C903E|nr:SOS response-associated peptidase [Roseitranquillus sediminis]MBM9594652.1 SOS response-associated peptidase [Roseitranquillus sediminis]